MVQGLDTSTCIVSDMTDYNSDRPPFNGHAQSRDPVRKIYHGDQTRIEKNQIVFIKYYRY